MLTGLFLRHRKTYELTYETNFQYSNEGQLVGHIVQAAIWTIRRSRLPGRDRRTLPADPCPLPHLILSHHGCMSSAAPSCRHANRRGALHRQPRRWLNMYLIKINSDKDPASDWTGTCVAGCEDLQKDVLGIEKCLAAEVRSERPSGYLGGAGHLPACEGSGFRVRGSGSGVAWRAGILPALMVQGST